MAPIREKDYIEVLSDNIQKRFRKELIELEQEYVKRHKPFCYRCAKIDFQNKLAKAIKERQVQVESAEGGNPDIIGLEYQKIMLDDLSIYGDIKRFELLKEEEVNADKVIAGVKTPTLACIRQNFRCTVRKCGYAVEVPVRLWEKRSGKEWARFDETEIMNKADEPIKMNQKSTKPIDTKKSQPTINKPGE